MSIVQYLKDTQAELRHVAWPTRLQTIVYTILVALISIFVALYLGLFDYLFTSGLAKILETLPTAPAAQEAPAMPGLEVNVAPNATTTE